MSSKVQTKNRVRSRIQIVCPICHKSGRIRLNESDLESSLSGTRQLVFEDTGICDHRIIAYLDNHNSVRGYLRSNCSYSDPPIHLQNLSNLIKKQAISSNRGDLRFFATHNDDFLKLMGNFYYYNPITILYEDRKQINELIPLLSLMKETNPNFFPFVITTSRSHFNTYSSMYEALDLMTLYDLDQHSFISSTLNDYEFEILKTLKYCLNSENYQKYLKSFFNRSRDMMIKMPNLNIKRFIGRYKPSSWMSSDIVDFMMTRNEMIARNISSVWGERINDFIHSEELSYFKKQITFDKSIREKYSRISSII